MAVIQNHDMVIDYRNASNRSYVGLVIGFTVEFFFLAKCFYNEPHPNYGVGTIDFDIWR